MDSYIDFKDYYDEGDIEAMTDEFSKFVPENEYEDKVFFILYDFLKNDGWGHMYIPEIFAKLYWAYYS